MRLFDVEEVQSETKSNEWYTPARYIEAARKVMGNIDLDPASCELANRTVSATKYYTKEDNGLAQEWHGRVWLNPPYGRTPEMKGAHKSTIDLFTSRLLFEYQRGTVVQAVLLVPATIGTNWFAPLWQYPICFHTGKINFASLDKHSTYSHAYGTVLVYFGTNDKYFSEIFSQFGRVVMPDGMYQPPAIQPTLWDSEVQP